MKRNKAALPNIQLPFVHDFWRFCSGVIEVMMVVGSFLQHGETGSGTDGSNGDLLAPAKHVGGTSESAG